MASNRTPECWRIASLKFNEWLNQHFRQGNLNQEANKNTNNSNNYQYIIKGYFRFHILFNEKSANILMYI